MAVNKMVAITAHHEDEIVCHEVKERQNGVVLRDKGGTQKAYIPHESLVKVIPAESVE